METQSWSENTKRQSLCMELQCQFGDCIRKKITMLRNERVPWKAWRHLNNSTFYLKHCFVRIFPLSQVLSTDPTLMKKDWPNSSWKNMIQCKPCRALKSKLAYLSSRPPPKIEAQTNWSGDVCFQKGHGVTPHFSVLGDNSSEISEVKGISQRAIFRQRWVASLKSIWAWKPSQRQTSNSRDEAEGGGKPSLPKRDGLYEQGAGS